MRPIPEALSVRRLARPLGRALAPRRDEGQLLLGSGNSYRISSSWRRRHDCATAALDDVWRAGPWKPIGSDRWRVDDAPCHGFSGSAHDR